MKNLRRIFQNYINNRTFFDWHEEIKDPLTEETLKQLQRETFIKRIKLGLISLLAAVIPCFIAFFIYITMNDGRIKDILFSFSLITASFPILLSLFCFTGNDEFDYLSPKYTDKMKEYYTLVVNCPEAAAFDQKIHSLKRLPTMGELEALKSITLAYLNQEAQKAFLCRNWDMILQN